MIKSVMSERKEQVKPLAPAAHRLDIDNNSDAAFLPPRLGRGRQNCIKICGCSTAVLLVATTALLVLMFTAFHIEDPSLEINSVIVKGVDGLNGPAPTGPGRNLTFNFDVSVKNRNVASFKFTNTTTSVYYMGSLVGESTGPPGEARARKRLTMGLSVGVMVGKIMEVGRLKSDLVIGMLNISSNTSIRGKVKITSAIKKRMVVKMNCNMSLNVRRGGIEDLICSSI